MFRIFYAENDATIYESSEYINTGIDEILEIGKLLGNDGSTLQKSRAVLKFDITEITNTLSKYSADLNSCKFSLQLYTTDDKYFYLNSYLEKNGEQSAIRIPKSDFQNLIEEGGLETIEVSQALKEQLLKPMKIYAKGGKMADGGKTRKNAKTTLKEAVGFDIDSIDISKL